MLYGQDRVLAHPLMTEGSPRQSENASFPLLRTFGDPVIENLDGLPPLEEIGLAPRPEFWRVNHRSQANAISSLHVRSPTIGNYQSRSAPISSSARSMVPSAFLLGDHPRSRIARGVIDRRRTHGWAIARPIRRAAKGATAIGNLDFDEVAPLSGSYFREINDLARSFNAMLDGLRAFGRYVPGTLVMKLVRKAGWARGPKNVCLPSCSPTSSASLRHARKCPPPRSPSSSINISRSSPPASTGRRHDRQVYRRCRHGVLGRTGPH